MLPFDGKHLGSNPSISTIKMRPRCCWWHGRLPIFGGGFETRRTLRVVNLFRKIPCVILMKSHINADEVQKVEYSLGMGKVMGSIPINSSNNKGRLSVWEP